MKYLFYIKKLKEFKCRSQIETKHFKNVTHVLSVSFYVMCLYIVWISKRVQIFIWLHFSWYLLYLIIFHFLSLFTGIKSIIRLKSTYVVEQVSRVVKVVIYEYVTFLHFDIFCPCFWQITTLSAKDHQPNKGGFLILMFHEEEEEQKEICVFQIGFY